MNGIPQRSLWRRLALLVALSTLILGATACGHLMLMGRDVQRPAESEFGVGPRLSMRQVYTATLRPSQPLRLRQLQTVQVLIADANGRPVDGAAVGVDGGMPEHGHGLPTQPRVKRGPVAGVYEIEGVRFNMGGWWELKLAIESAAGTDNVTFNLSL